MSQFRRFKNEVLKDVDERLFFETMEELGFECKKQNQVSNAYGKDSVDGAFVRDGKTLPIGYKFIENSDGKLSLEVRGDFWNTGLRENEFVNQISQMYQKNRITNTLEDNGLLIDDIIRNKSKDLVITARMIG